MNCSTNWRRTTCRLATLALLVGIVLSGCAIYACNVPVFRYALERWHPDPYRATLFHRGPLTEAQRALVRPWEESSGPSPANVALQIVDVDAIEEDDLRTLFAAQSSPQLPWLALQYPKSLRIEKTVWAGSLSDEAVTRLVVSPLRTELIKRLAAGQTAVWLMLESGRADKDDAVAAQLAEEMKQLTRKLTLPELTTAPEDSLLSDAPLSVSFSLLRVPRDAPAEKPLVELLLHSEPDLVEFREPMVFPVFGRGRALLPLIGAGITPDNIHESAAFLVGACSCEIKELNPGFDLLLAAEWDTLLFKDAPPVDVVATRTVAAVGKPELIAIPAGAPSATAPINEETSLEFTYVASTLNFGRFLPVAFVLLAAVVVAIAFKRFI